ncbi:allantoicase [compost metagenome]
MLLEDLDVPNDFLSNRNLNWTPILPRTKLEAHTRHYFDSELIAGGPYSHVRLSIYPDGGVSRLRLWGRPIERAAAEE